MANFEKSFVIVANIANTNEVKNRLVDHENDPEEYLQNVICTEVGIQLQALCGNDVALTNKINPFVLELTEAKQVLRIAKALIGEGESKIEVPIPNSPDPLQFYVGIALNEGEFSGVASAHALAGRAGPNEIYIGHEVAESVTFAKGDMEILFLGKHRLLDSQAPIYQLRSAQPGNKVSSEDGEMVRLSLAVIDIMHSTNLKPLMGRSNQERLENYERKVLTPFRKHTAELAKKFDGTIVDQTGDACFLSFDDPDQARQWTRAILEKEHRIAAPESYDFPEVKYHLSIDSGMVWRSSKGTLQGTAVDRVHRLNDLTQEDQIILSPSVATALDLGVEDGKVHRHKSANLQGFVEDVEIWEYCLPGHSPRAPRKGKGQTQLKPAALVAVSGRGERRNAEQELDNSAIEKTAKYSNGKEARLTGEQAESTRVFAFDRVQDGIRFVIDAKKTSQTPCGGAIHYGLVMEKNNGLLEGSSAGDTVSLLPESDSIRMSGSARNHIGEREHSRFKVKKIEGETATLQDQRESIYEIVPKIHPAWRWAAKAGAVLALIAIGLSLFDYYVSKPNEKQRALFVSMAPALDGVSWWFEVSPWFTPEMRQSFYETSGKKMDLSKLKRNMLVSTEASLFYSKLKNSLPDNDTLADMLIELRSSMEHKDYQSEAGRSKCYEIIEHIFHLRSGLEMRSTDWHLVANILTSLKPSDSQLTSDEFTERFGSVFPKFENSTNDYKRAVHAYKRAESLYKSAFRKSKNELDAGLLVLCYSDWARLHYVRREFNDSLLMLTQSDPLLAVFEKFNLHHVYIRALRGESRVRSLFINQSKETNLERDIERIEQDFKLASAALHECFSPDSDTQHFYSNVLTRDVNQGQHLYTAVISQMRAHYYLESWQLDKSQKMAEKALDTRRLITAVVRLNENDSNSDAPQGPVGESHIYLDVCLEFIRCHLLQALAAHYSGNAHDAELALSQAINMSLRAQENKYLGKDEPWQEHLPNFWQRFADYHIFLSGDLEAAMDQLENSLKAAEERNWHQPENNRHPIYVGLKSRVALVKALEGNYSESKQVLDEMKINKDKMHLYFEVAEAFAQPAEPREESLRKILRSKGSDQAISRDDRQLLLLVSEYVLEVSAKDRRAEIEMIYQFLAAPLKRGANKTMAYRHLLHNRVSLLLPSNSDPDTVDAAKGSQRPPVAALSF